MMNANKRLNFTELDLINLVCDFADKLSDYQRRFYEKSHHTERACYELREDLRDFIYALLECQDDLDDLLSHFDSRRHATRRTR